MPTGDPFKKVRPGDKLRIPAPAYNAFIDAALDLRARRQNATSQDTPSFRQSGIITVKNCSGENRERFDVLGIDDPIFLPDQNENSFKNRVMFDGVTPVDPDHKGKFVVLLEPLKPNAIGMACIDGVCPAWVTLPDDSGGGGGSPEPPKYADIQDGDASALQALGAGEGGGAQILWIDPELAPGESGWAIVRLGLFATRGVWVQITQTQTDHGLYSNWQEVELTDAGDGTLTWSPVSGGLSGPQDGMIYEVNGVENIPENTVVQVFANQDYDPATGTLPAWLFQYEHPPIGFGVPADGESDVPFDTDIALTVTDASGNPLLDDDGQPQTIKVWRNTLRHPLYTDFDANSIFTYVRFPQPVGDIEGCIFSRTEAFKSYQNWLPPDGYSLYPEFEQPPLSHDVTGNPGNSKHFHLIGKMFIEDDAGGKGWTAWSVLDPDALGLYKVKVDSFDEFPGYLGEKLFVDETWLHKSIVNEQVKIEHIGPDWAVDFRDILDAEIINGPNGKVLRLWSEEVTFDDKGHYTWEGQWNNHDVDLPDEKVAADWMDLQPGYLDDKLIVDETWLHKTVVGGQVKIEHWGPDGTTAVEAKYVSGLDMQGKTLIFPTAAIDFDFYGHEIEVWDETQGFPQVEFLDDDWIEIQPCGFGGNYQLQFQHIGPCAQSYTIDPIDSIAVTPDSLLIKSKPLSIDSCGHVRMETATPVEHELLLRRISVIIDMQVTSNQVQVKRQDIYVPVADPPGEWETIHTGTNCPSGG